MTLRMFPMIIDAYRLFLANLGVYAKLIWFPAVAQFAAAVFSLNYVPGLEPDSSENLLFPGIALEIFAAFLAIPAVTAWSRLVIFGKGDSGARIAYSIRSAEWRYLWRSLVIHVLALAAVLCVLFAMSEICLTTASCEAVEAVMLTGPATTILLGVALLSLVRFMLVLPAVAVGHKMRFGDSWRITKGTGFQLGFLVFLAASPVYICPAILEYAFFGGLQEGDVVYPIGYLILEAIVYWFVFTIDVSVLALVFKKHVLDPTPG